VRTEWYAVLAAGGEGYGNNALKMHERKKRRGIPKKTEVMLGLALNDAVADGHFVLAGRAECNEAAFVLSRL
jgi:hypothetical protein